MPDIRYSFLIIILYPLSVPEFFLFFDFLPLTSYSLLPTFLAAILSIVRYLIQ